MMENELNLVLPESLRKEMKVHAIFQYPGVDDLSVLAMLHDMSVDKVGHVVRLYMMRRENDELLVELELEAFAFPDEETAVLFAIRVPNMTALEILMIQGGNNFALESNTTNILQ